MIWKNKIIIENLKGSFEEIKNQIFIKLNDSNLFKDLDSLENLKDADDISDFDYFLNEIYDYCDENKIWLEVKDLDLSEVTK